MDFEAGYAYLNQDECTMVATYIVSHFFYADLKAREELTEGRVFFQLVSSLATDEINAKFPACHLLFLRKIRRKNVYKL